MRIGTKDASIGTTTVDPCLSSFLTAVPGREGVSVGSRVDGGGPVGPRVQVLRRFTVEFFSPPVRILPCPTEWNVC